MGLVAAVQAQQVQMGEAVLGERVLQMILQAHQ